MNRIDEANDKWTTIRSERYSYVFKKESISSTSFIDFVEFLFRFRLFSSRPSSRFFTTRDKVTGFLPQQFFILNSGKLIDLAQFFKRRFSKLSILCRWVVQWADRACKILSNCFQAITSMRLQERQKHGLAKWACLLNISVQIMRWWLHRLSRDVENWILPHKLPQRVHLSWFQSPITNHHVYSTFLGEKIIDEIARFFLFLKKYFKFKLVSRSIVSSIVELFHN